VRLLVVSACFPPAWSWGGPVRSIWNMCRGLVEAGADMRVITTDADLSGRVEVGRRRREHGMEIRTHAVPVWGGAVAGRYAFAPGSVGALWHEIPRTDLCVFQGPWTFLLAVGPRICRLRGVPYVVIPRGALEGISLSEKGSKKRIYLRLVEARTIARAAAVQFASDLEQRNSLPAIGTTPSFVCENALEPGRRVNPDGSWLRERLGISAAYRVVGLAGRVHPRKGFEVIVPALARCTPPVHLVSFGSDEAGYGATVRELSRQFGVSDRVHFCGQLQGEQLQRTYASVDLLVMPSYGESFGNAALEALAQGTRVLVSDRVPLGGYIEAQGLGAVVSGMNPEDWARQLARLTQDDSLQDRDRISRKVRVDYDVKRKGEQLLGKYAELACRNGGRR